jgi:tetraacyldisaccharide 4'-kinase
MPLGYIYKKIIEARAARYKSGAARSYDLGAPVISVGNITVGGTGKTPLVAFIAGMLAKNGLKVCILTRGYKRKNPGQRVVVSDRGEVLADVAEAGDEPFELAKDLLGVSAVIADRDRMSAGLWAKEHLGTDVFLLDDGFQHFRIKRDLDLVTIDAMNPFGNGRLLPQGILREPVKNLERADVVVITRADLAGDVDPLKAKVQALAPKARIFTAQNKISNLIPLGRLFDGEPDVIPSLLPKTRCLAFCAIGNAESFFRQLMAAGYELAGTHRFHDHHKYTERSISKLNELARKWKADILLTTVKDAVKLSDFSFEVPCYVVKSTPLIDDEEGLREIVLRSLNN